MVDERGSAAIDARTLRALSLKIGNWKSDHRRGFSEGADLLDEAETLLDKLADQLGSGCVSLPSESEAMRLVLKALRIQRLAMQSGALPHALICNYQHPPESDATFCNCGLTTGQHALQFIEKQLAGCVSIPSEHKRSAAETSELVAVKSDGESEPHQSLLAGCVSLAPDAEKRIEPRYMEVSRHELMGADSRDFLWGCFHQFRGMVQNGERWKGDLRDNLVWMWRGDFEKLLAVARAAPVERWQPIETAPKVHPLNFGKELLLAWVAPGIGEWIFVVGQWRDGWWSGEHKAYPTHWTPLPDPPKADPVSPSLPKEK